MNIELLRGLSPRARQTLEALDIGSRETDPHSMSFSEATLQAQGVANRDRVEMVVGWQINDATGLKEPGYCPRAALELMTLEPVGLVYPL